MIRQLVAGLGLAMILGAQARAQSCMSYTTLSNGNTADASQVMGNFTCAALVGQGRFTGIVGINTPDPTTGAVLSVTPTGNNWNEGIEINPSPVDNYGNLSLRSTANSITGSWGMFNASPSDATGPHSLGFALNGLTGMSGTGRVDTPFSITTSGVSRFGGPVGIGVSDPSLGGIVTSVFTAVNTATAIAAAYNPSTPGFAVNPQSNGSWQIYDHEGGVWRLDLSGLNGGIIVGSGGSPGPLFYVNGSAGGLSAWQVNSDARLKKNIRTISGALETINQLRGVRYDWKPPEERTVGKTLPLPLKAPQVGFVAQEVAKIVPEAVAVPTSESDGVYGLRMDALIPFMVEAIKTQQAEIAALQTQVAELKAAK